MSVSYGELKGLVNTANKSSSNKSFAVLERKIQKSYSNAHKEEIKYVKQLIKKVKDNKPADLSMLIGSELFTKDEKLELLNDLVKEHNEVSIPLNFSLMLQDLPKTLQSLKNPKNKTTRTRATTRTVKKKPSKNAIQKLRTEDDQRKEVLAKQVLSIEPLNFFVLLPFYAFESDQQSIIEEILDLDENMMPNKYTIFESFNTIIEKKHLTGEYFEYNIKQSDISKKFMELEPSLQKVLFDFTKLSTTAIKKAREEMLELITVLKVLYDLKPADYSSLAPTVIKNIIRIYSNLIKNSKGDADIINYLIRSIKLLEHRRQKMHQELPQLMKDDDKRKFLTKETSELVQGAVAPQIQQEVQPEDAELGEHYTERFEDEGFDDFDIVVEDDSELLG